MRILITGGCGFLGSHLVEHFLKTTDADTQIVVLDKLTYASNGYDRLRDISEHLPYGLPDRVKILGCDLALPVPEGILRELGAVDYIIHAAAESHVDNSIADPLPFLESNVLGTHHLLMLARRMLGTARPSLRRIFLVSTDEVYGPAATGHPGYDEDVRFRPANPYAASKAGAEAVAMAYANTYRLPITIVNTMNLIGERQHPEKFVPLVIRKVLANDTVLIHADPTCTHSGTRFYLHCRTFANALAWLIAHDRRPDRPNSFDALVDERAVQAVQGAGRAPDLPLKLHVCGEREISNLALAKLIAGYVGRPLFCKLVDFHSSRPGHDLRYAMNDQRIQDLGWKRPMNLEQSLEKTVAWYLANPTWLQLSTPRSR